MSAVYLDWSAAGDWSTASAIKRRLRAVRYEVVTQVLRTPVLTPADVVTRNVPYFIGRPVRISARVGLEIDWRVAREQIRSLCSFPGDAS